MPYLNKNNNPINNKPGLDNKKSIFGKNVFGAERGDISKEFLRMRDATRARGRHITTIKEKRMFEQEILPRQKYGQHVSPQEIEHEIGRLKKHLSLEKRSGGNIYEASKIQDKIDVLNKLKEK